MNPLQKFKDLIAPPPMTAGVVTDVTGGKTTVTLVNGGKIQAYTAPNSTVGDRVVVQGDSVLGRTPGLTSVTLDI